MITGKNLHCGDLTARPLTTLVDIPEALAMTIHNIQITLRKSFFLIKPLVLPAEPESQDDGHQSAKTAETSQRDPSLCIARLVLVRVQVAREQMRAVGQGIDHRQCRGALALRPRDGGADPGERHVECGVDT